MNSKRKAFIEYIEEIKKVTGLSPTDIGIKAGVAGSTVTRPMSSDEWASKITLKTLSSLAAFSDIQPPESLLADLIPGKTAGPATQKTARGEEMKNALLPKLVAAAMFLSDADMETLIGLAERMSGISTQHENPTGRGRTS